MIRTLHLSALALVAGCSLLSGCNEQHARAAGYAKPSPMRSQNCREIGSDIVCPKGTGKIMSEDPLRCSRGPCKRNSAEEIWCAPPHGVAEVTGDGRVACSKFFKHVDCEAPAEKSCRTRRRRRRGRSAQDASAL